MYVLQIASKEGISNRGFRERQGAFREKIIDIYRGHPLREWFEVFWKLVLEHWCRRKWWWCSQSSRHPVSVDPGGVEECIGWVVGELRRNKVLFA